MKTSSSRSLLSLVLCLATIFTVDWVSLPIAFCQGQVAKSADVNKATGHFNIGNAFFEKGEYGRAIFEFEVANSFAPHPLLLFNIGLCHDKLGQYSDAINFYEQYLDQERSGDAVHVQEVRKRLVELKGEPGPNRVAGGDPFKKQGDADTYGSKNSESAIARLRALNLDELVPKSSIPGSQLQEDTSPTQAGPTQTDPRTFSEAGTNGAVKPLYKQWWFWVVVGVGAVVLIDVATSSSGSPKAQAQPFAPVFRF